MNSISCGEDKKYTLSFKDSAGVAIPITGWKVYFTMKKDLSQIDNNADFKIDIITHDDPIYGITSIHLTNEETSLLKPGIYFYDIRVKRADNMILTITTGEIEVRMPVTRRKT